MSNNQIELTVLSVRDNAANCKILKTNERIWAMPLETWTFQGG